MSITKINVMVQMKEAAEISESLGGDFTDDCMLLRCAIKIIDQDKDPEVLCLLEQLLERMEGKLNSFYNLENCLSKETH